MGSMRPLHMACIGRFLDNTLHGLDNATNEVVHSSRNFLKADFFCWVEGGGRRVVGGGGISTLPAVCGSYQERARFVLSSLLFVLWGGGHPLLQATFQSTGTGTIFWSYQLVVVWPGGRLLCRGKMMGCNGEVNGTV